MSDADASFLREQKADFKPISFHALQRERTLRFIHRAGARVSRTFRARAGTFHDESSDLNAAPDGFFTPASGVGAGFPPRCHGNQRLSLDRH